MTREKLEKLIRALISLRDAATDESALESVDIYPAWKADTDYEVDGNRLRYNDKLYRARQAHHSQAEYTPDITPALWELVVVDHSGTADDPIPFDLGMAIEDGKYYTEDSVRYKCIRDSINPLYNHLADLIGIYVVVE